MASKQKVLTPEGDHGRLEKRDVISDKARKWQEENAEATEAWANWAEKNGVPLPPRF